jgi:excisionase family DNA binding protein
MQIIKHTAYTVGGAAQRMGISKWLLYDMLAQGEIPYFRIRNRAIRIDSADLERWLAAHRVVGPRQRQPKTKPVRSRRPNRSAA